MSYKVKVTIPPEVFKGAKLIFEVTHGKVIDSMSSDGTYLCGTGCSKTYFDNPTRVSDKKVELALSTS